jgi:hypothetical protein
MASSPWAVLNALRDGDTNGNGLAELSEIVAHVQSVVPEIAAGLDDNGEPGKQTALGSRAAALSVSNRSPFTSSRAGDCRGGANS